MSYNPKLIKLQKNISLNELKNSDLNLIEEFISEDNITVQNQVQRMLVLKILLLEITINMVFG